MAPISQPPTANGEYDGSSPRFNTLQSWLDQYGPAEYALYKKDSATKHLSYEEWADSEHVLGPYLYHTTLDVWGEETSSDEESDLEAVNFVSPDLPKRGPAKTVTANGNGMPRAAKTSTPTAYAKADDLSTSTKKKRRQRKKYLSEEIVASDDSDDVEESAPAIEVKTPSAPSTTIASANGRRKSSARKPRKKFLSEENISPEDLEEDTMSIDGVVGPVASSTTAIRSGPHTPAKMSTPKSAKTGPVKAGSGRRSKKKSSSEATVPIEDYEDEPGNIVDVVTPGTPTAVTSAAASPEDPNAPSSASARRGLRTRTPAQQRPYFHHAKLFEEQEGDGQSVEQGAKPSPPKTRPTRLAVVSYPDEDLRDLEDLDEESIMVLQEEDPIERKPKHFKGKGRAWKKDEEDEDLDYVSPVKAREPKKQQPKRKGRPKKEKTSRLSDDWVRDDSDWNDAEDAGQNEESMIQVQPIAQETSKSRSRTRKSDQSVASSKASHEHDEGEDSTLGFKKSTPKGKSAPKRPAASAISLEEDVEGPDKKGEDEEIKENDEEKHTSVSPSRKARKRKSGGSEGGHCKLFSVDAFFASTNVERRECALQLNL